LVQAVAIGLSKTLCSLLPLSPVRVSRMPKNGDARNFVGCTIVLLQSINGAPQGTRARVVDVQSTSSGKRSRLVLAPACEGQTIGQLAGHGILSDKFGKSFKLADAAEGHSEIDPVVAESSRPRPSSAVEPSTQQLQAAVKQIFKDLRPPTRRLRVNCVTAALRQRWLRLPGKHEKEILRNLGILDFHGHQGVKWGFCSLIAQGPTADEEEHPDAQEEWLDSASMDTLAQPVGCDTEEWDENGSWEDRAIDEEAVQNDWEPHHELPIVRPTKRQRH